jgi:MFS family permease
MGGAIYLLPYVKYSFYTQMMEYIGCTNTQLNFMLSVYAFIAAAIMIPGGMVADKFDCRKIIILSVGAQTLFSFLHAMTAHSYSLGLACWVGQSLATNFAYWPGLQKYITSLQNKGEAASSYGRYYFFNGLSGTLGNVIPLWAMQKLGGGYPTVVWTMGIMTLIATVLCFFFLESEEDMKARGVVFEEEEPIRLSDFKFILTWPGFYMFFISEVTVYTMYTQISFMTPYLVDVMGIDPEASTVFSIIRTYAAMLLAPVGGFLASRVFKSTALYQRYTFAIVAVLCAGIFLFNENSNVTLVSIYTLLPALLIMPCYSVKFSIVEECYIPQAIMGTAIGITALIPVVDGIEPILFGWWLDKFGNTGYTFIFIFLVAACVLCVFNTFWIKSHEKKVLAGIRVPRGGLKAAPETTDAE